MIVRRSYLLLEVVVGLALLATLGVVLVRLQAGARRQYRQAQERDQIAAQAEQLLWTWSASRTPVTLPATGRLNDRWSWRREACPLRVATGVLPTQVSLIVTAIGDDGRVYDAYRVDWLVPEASRRAELP